MKRVLLLGGGHAHVHVLQGLAQQPLASAEVELVSPFARQMYSGMVPGLVAGRYTAEACAIGLGPLARAAGVRFVEASVVGFDAASRRVVLSNGEERVADVVSFDTGSTMNRDRIAGAREHALFVRPIEHFVKLLDGVFELATRRALDVVVVGGGAAGVELALAFEHRLQALNEAGVRVALVTGGPSPLEGHGASAQGRVQRELSRRRITVIRDSCAHIEAGSLTLAGGARLACDVPVIAVGGEAPAWLADSGLQLDEQGFVATGPTLQSLSHPQVFAAGDVASRPDDPHPRSGVYAVRAGPPLLANLRAFVAGGALRPHRPQRRTLSLVACGDGRAIASWGGWSTQGHWVGWWKDRIDRAFVQRYRRPAEAPIPAVGTPR